MKLTQIAEYIEIVADGLDGTATAQRLMQIAQELRRSEMAKQAEQVAALARLKVYPEGDDEGEIAADGEDAMRVLNFHIRAAREMLGIEPDEDEEDEGCPLCSRCGCPESDHTEDCRCGGFLEESPSLPAFRAGAPVRVKSSPDHRNQYDGQRGTLVCQDGEMWHVVLPQHGITRAFHPDELTVLE